MSLTGREYPARPLVGIGVAVLRGESVLLIRRSRAPAAGQWSLPGGAQRLGETAEEAARRELKEETGLEVGALHLAGNVDSIHLDSDGRVQFHYTILDFCTTWVSSEPVAGGDAADIVWAGLDDLDSFQLWDEARRIVLLSRAICAQA